MATNSTLSKLLKNSNIQNTTVLNDSNLYKEKDIVKTDYPIINIAFSGSINGGFTEGIHQFAGPSKHFKTCMALICASSFLQKYDDGIILLYDSEGGMPDKYFKNFNIDPNRVVYSFIKNMEELKIDVVKQLDLLEKQDHVLILLDSLGNLASKKELDDTLDSKSVADMSRAKQAKSLFRMVTPYLVEKNIPMFVINHTYKEIGSIFPRDIVGGGCLAKGHAIITKDGLKDISEIVVGDLVLTHTDNYKPVTHTWTSETIIPQPEHCYEIEFEDGTKMVTSDRHRVLKDNEWVYVSDLKVGDVI